MCGQNLQFIFDAIESGKCLAFLGAGACTDFLDREDQKIEGLPTGENLAKLLAAQCKYTNGEISDLPKVAEYFLYKKSGQRDDLENAIRKIIQVGCSPRPIHTAIAQLTNIRVVLTSNYDTILENELDKYGRLVKKHIYSPEDSKTGHFEGSIFFEDKEIILHKMHGCVTQPGSMVITTSDYIRYLANLNDIDRGMPEYFRKTVIPQFTLLFLGYSLTDWNFQVIWDGVMSNFSQAHKFKKSYAFVRKIDPFQAAYWRDRNVILIEKDLSEFAKALADRFNLKIPQLGM